MILMMILIEFRKNDYLLHKQVLSQSEHMLIVVQSSFSQKLKATSFNCSNGDFRSMRSNERHF